MTAATPTCKSTAMPRKKKTRDGMVTVTQAAEQIGVAPSTVYGMMQRGELTVIRDGGRLLLDADQVTKAPTRKRGRQAGPAKHLIGAKYARELARGKSIAAIAEHHGVTRQAVSKDLTRYSASVVREGLSPRSLQLLESGVTDVKVRVRRVKGRRP